MGRGQFGIIHIIYKQDKQNRALFLAIKILSGPRVEPNLLYLALKAAVTCPPCLPPPSLLAPS